MGSGFTVTPIPNAGFTQIPNAYLTPEQQQNQQQQMQNNAGGSSGFPPGIIGAIFQSIIGKTDQGRIPQANINGTPFQNIYNGNSGGGLLDRFDAGGKVPTANIGG